MKTPETRKQLEGAGIEPAGEGADALAKHLAARDDTRRQSDRDRRHQGGVRSVSMQRHFFTALVAAALLVVVGAAQPNLSVAADRHGGAVRRRRHVRRHGPHHRGAHERAPGPAGRGREHHRRGRHHRRDPRHQRRARRLHDPARLDRHARLQPDDLQEAPLRRRQRFHAGHAVLRAADGARSAQGPSRQHHSGVRRASEGERRQDAIRLGRRRLDHASRLRAAQLDDRRRGHARSLSRLGAGRRTT